MGEVRYSVNGKYFKDYGVYISSSDGLFDALKRKKVNTYDWAEYHGSSPDLSAPKFEQREISLKGFVTGANWELMKSNFDTIISEFQKAGTQRLLIEPFGLKPLPYEVYMVDDVNLSKTFKDGKMVGVFTLKLIEPNPLKIVLYTTGTTLSISYNSPNETEIFYGNGVKDVVSGNASFSGKTLANREVSEYAFEGRNLVLNSSKVLSSNAYHIGVLNLSEDLIDGQEYVFTAQGALAGSNQIYIGQSPSTAQITFAVNDTAYHYQGKFVFQKSPSYPNDVRNKLMLFNAGSTNYAGSLSKFKLEKGNKATPYSSAPEDEKIIIIAGNIEEITGLTTNADVLWEKL